MAEVKKSIEVGMVMGILGFIYTTLRPWLVSEAAKTTTPIDDWMISFFDKLLGVQA